ncbi:MAG: hypothetical protein K9L61_02915, partial [Candidatus Omnitrophica bacterium]|nr:hypothetical protein [Candidatus Omnitrophota bacterium]
MSNKPRTKIINIIDKVAFGFFIILAFFFPISSAIIEISVVFILLCFIVKFIFTESKAKKIKEFFKERINLSLLVFWLCLGLSIFAAGPYYSESIRAWFSKWGEGVFLFYAACIFLDKKKVVFLLKVLLLSSLLISINGL